ncbi:RagB/SusD family nutrient uptake outer membrane protein [Mucilaginibacter aquaedulcis]|uniref:RagB/SusD family nutrient uptake outer membrane protein n=1 Tax=Mucilaginibacter aquaedulcis TaxID=1187081 RepID=UPI0025B5A956|nr:RagB/SusD family nutrient uptake outer membrane protein [Mucilaginibacter aquaedulcis]MDN3550005.1 RagB/SusD family nutrient uptake outer membrane protein [Mucilaginibacter aquaedulcis]
MKKILYIAFIGITLLSACSKSLDREPLSQISPDKSFNSENELRLYVLSFYDKMLPYSDYEDNGFTSLYGENSDNIILNSLDQKITGNRLVPVSGGGWTWDNLRNVNYFLQNYSRGGLSPAITDKYVAVAKFFRAYFYANMVAHFGDVPWYSKPIDATDNAALTKGRDSRTVVMDSVLNDIDFAVAHLPVTTSTVEVSKWTALALKSRLALFEGTFRKYHTEFKIPNAEKFLQASADAAGQMIDQSPYTVYNSTTDKAYGDLFNSLTSNPAEIILARPYSASLQIFHNVNYYTVSPSFGKPGLEKRLVNSYLMKDGSRFTDKAGYNTMQFADETKDRDPRLAQTIRTPGYKRVDGTVVLPPSYSGTVTGYQLTKFVTAAPNDANGKSPNPLPIFRYAEVLLNYAEAKAELGTLTQADLDKSVKKLRDRVGMPAMVMAAANTSPDLYLASQYTGVTGANKGVILEIRRERRIELVMEGFRYNDLLRWKEGHLLTDQFKGAYFPGTGSYDLDRDGKTDLVIYTGDQPNVPNAQFLKLGVDVSLENGTTGGNIVVNPTTPKKFNEDRDYLYPLPTQDLLLNPNLKQNPNW